MCVCALACALLLSRRTFSIGHLGHWAIWGSSSWTRPAHISAVAMEIAPGLEMKAPSAIRRVDEQLFRLEGCRKTPALMCSWRGPSLHAQGFPSQKHSNALKKVKSWRGLSDGPNKKIEGPNKKIRRTYVSKGENFEILFGIRSKNQTKKQLRTLPNG